MFSPGRGIDEARTALQHILESIGVRSSVCRLEPASGMWQLHLEYTVDGNGGEWRSYSAPISPVLLSTSVHDTLARDRLREMLTEKLCGQW